MSTQHDRTEDSTGPESPGELLHDLTAFRRDALVAIAELQAGPEACYGLAIKDRLEAFYDGEIRHGQLYPNLDWLVDRGLVVKGDIDRRTHSYELTDDGHAVIEDLWWRTETALGRLNEADAVLGGGD